MKDHQIIQFFIFEVENYEHIIEFSFYKKKSLFILTKFSTKNL